MYLRHFSDVVEALVVTVAVVVVVVLWIVPLLLRVLYLTK